MAARFHGRSLRRVHHLFFFQPANAEPVDGRRLVPGRGERHPLGCLMSRRSLGGPSLRRCSQPVTHMEIPHEATLLRIFIGESDRHENRPLYEAIVLKSRETPPTEATVLPLPMGSLE